MPVAPLPPTHQQPPSQMATPSPTMDVLPTSHAGSPPATVHGNIPRWTPRSQQPHTHQVASAHIRGWELHHAPPNPMPPATWGFNGNNSRIVRLRSIASYLHFHQSRHVRYISSTRQLPVPRHGRKLPLMVAMESSLDHQILSSRNHGRPEWIQTDTRGGEDPVDAAPIPGYGRHQAGDPVLCVISHGRRHRTSSETTWPWQSTSTGSPKDLLP